MRRQAGITLMEVLIAVTLLSMLSLGMLFAMRIGLSAFTRTDSKLMDNRRVAGAQRILEQQLLGLMPVVSLCGEAGTRFGFFQGEERTMRLVSTFSLQQAWRGQPQILEMFVIPGEEGAGFRLVVNEILYTGPASAGRLCTGGGVGGLNFVPVAAAPTSFVLADKLAYCRFRYLGPGETPTSPGVWQPAWNRKGWPFAVRVEMAPLEPTPARLQPISVTVPVYLYRSPDFRYVDQ
jgi:type II secretory pathway component PulJ